MPEALKQREPAAIERTIAALAARFGNKLVTSEAVRRQHANTTTWLDNEPPDAVIYAASTEDVQGVIGICAEHRVPVIPFGTGTSLEGHVNAPLGGVCIDLMSMNRVLKVHAEDLDCVIEPGVTRKQLNEYLRDQGLFFPIDPGADASLGGMAATRASGTNAVRYGTMKDNVLALKAVLANGEVITTARRAKKSSAGYDLTRLFVGSEGTLGVITELTLKLAGIPEAISAGVCPFPSVEAACNATIATIQAGIPVARIELLDELQVKASNAYSKLTLAETPTLFLEFHGSNASVAEQSESFGQIAAEFGGGPFAWATKPEDRTKLWQARHDAYWAVMNLRKGATGFATDVCVPISRLAECVVATQKRHRRDEAGGADRRPRGRRQFPRLGVVRPQRQGRDRARAQIPRAAGGALALHGRHFYRRARGRPGQAQVPCGRARRGGARRHARHQAGARPAEHHESGEDSDALK